MEPLERRDIAGPLLPDFLLFLGLLETLLFLIVLVLLLWIGLGLFKLAVSCLNLFVGLTLPANDLSFLILMLIRLEDFFFMELLIDWLFTP